MAFPIPGRSCVLLLFVLPFLSVSETEYNVSLGTSLLASDGSSSWKSPSGDFAFGFRPLANGSLFLLAIWFEKIPEKTIVWYADGSHRAPKGSKVELKADGQFTLEDPQGQVIWQALSDAHGVAYAAMLDTGNFVLANEDSSYVWESFKRPADTILPTQVLEFGGMLSSRQAEGNYSKGRFQLRLLSDGNLVLNTFNLESNTEYDAY